MSGQQYHLKVINKSSREWVFFVYQKAPDTESEKVFSLAWCVSPYKVRVNDHIDFQWSIDYQFIWRKSGLLKQGIRYTEGGDVDCTPDDKNTTTFTFPQGGAPGLSPPITGSDQGTLYIQDGPNIPDEAFSVGIGMSTAGTYLVQAGPNLTHKFTPTPNYWVAAGNEMKVGTTLDIQTITKQAAEVVFPRRIYSMVATLTDANTWEVTKDTSGDTNTVAAVSTTNTHNTTTTTTYNACALM